MAYELSPLYAQMQNNMTEHMFCPTTGCPQKIEVGGGYYIPGDPWRARNEIDLYKLSLLLVIGCTLWEYLVTFYSEELQRWGDIFRGQIVPVNILTLFSRYCIAAASIIAAAYVYFESSSNCQAKLSALMTCLAFVWMATALIYTLRVHAMYARPNERNTVRIPIVCVWLVGSALWISSIPGFKAAAVNQLIRQPFSGGCSPAPSPQWRAMGFGAAAIFDVVILVFSIRSVSRHSSEKFRPIYKAFRYGISDRNDTGGFIILSSTITFIISFPLNTICFFVTVFSKNLILSNIPIAIAALFNFMIATRLVFHSNQWSQGKSALLTMPATYKVHKRGGSNDYDRGTSFNAIANAIAKRKVPNDPFDQFTIEQAIESHARMDAMAWRDYMQGPAPQDIRDAVTGAIWEEKQQLKASKNEKVRNSFMHRDSIQSTGESSSAPSVRHSSRYKSRLEMELAQMDGGEDSDNKKSKTPSIEDKEEIESLPVALANNHTTVDIETPSTDYYGTPENSTDVVYSHNFQFPSTNQYPSSSVPEGWTVQAFTQPRTPEQQMEEGAGTIGLREALNENPPFAYSNRSTTPQQEGTRTTKKIGKSFFDSVLKKNKGDSSIRINDQDRLPNDKPSEGIRYQTDVIQVSDRET
ncbi:uncharacterized protein FA14DRAFT_162539 [Meira miltonrushii]|uniref:Uncharacterized protein n=1 Tax=Meira miltonrushii TaxID=1280837 RepID=A0A316V1V1_9BASI|nr:uncharacterized protein FA14DRAFT_162539 [Meira miltonrushii]PWN31530.1 hypothetical protein FA14DRAFT_162539 [Meira miltonrushii]